MSSQDRVSHDPPSVPRAVIHKKILEVAKARPDASIESLVSEVNGASVDLVKRVLEEYGDPAGGEQAENTTNHEETTDKSTMQGIKANGNSTEPSTEVTPSHESVDLTDKQRKALQMIRDHPHASQRDLAERLGISQSTINSRLNSIEGFDWDHRQSFARSVLEKGSTPSDGPDLELSPADSESSSSSNENITDELETLAERITTLERQLESGMDTEHESFTDPELISKMVRACMNAEDITSEEEQRIIAQLVTTGKE